MVSYRRQSGRIIAIGKKAVDNTRVVPCYKVTSSSIEFSIFNGQMGWKSILHRNRVGFRRVTSGNQFDPAHKWWLGANASAWRTASP